MFYGSDCLRVSGSRIFSRMNTLPCRYCWRHVGWLCRWPNLLRDISPVLILQFGLTDPAVYWALACFMCQSTKVFGCKESLKLTKWSVEMKFAHFYLTQFNQMKDPYKPVWQQSVRRTLDILYWHISRDNTEFHWSHGSLKLSAMFVNSDPKLPSDKMR